MCGHLLLPGRQTGSSKWKAKPGPHVIGVLVAVGVGVEGMMTGGIRIGRAVGRGVGGSGVVVGDGVEVGLAVAVGLGVEVGKGVGVGKSIAACKLCAVAAAAASV